MDLYTEISLFAGYGGFALGLRLAGLPVQTVCYVEIDGYCQKLIQARIRDGYLDDAPIWDDIRTFDGRPWRESVDLLTAGFPCQPHSVAGQRHGADDERNLWPDTLRVIREVGPSYVLLENVPGILANGYGGTVVGQLTEAGYDCIWDCVSAAEVGAPHLRLRWWCLAYAQQQRRQGREVHRGDQPTALPGRAADTFESGGPDVANAQGIPGWHVCRQDLPNPGSGEGGVSNGGGILADTPGKREQPGSEALSKQGGRSNTDNQSNAGNWWAVEPDVGRVAHGVASRVDRLRALGNGIVPAVVREFYRQRRS